MPLNTPENELNALIRLLDEPDENIFVQIADSIFAWGTAALPLLKQELTNNFNPLVEERLNNIIQRIQNENLYLELTNWVHFGSHDLLKGTILLARFHYPDLDELRITQMIGQLTQDVWIEMHDTMLSLDKIKVMNHILFDVHHFTPNPKDAFALQDMFIQQVLDVKRGNALTLGIIYIILAQGLKIPVYGVDLPHHFILACLRSNPSSDSGLFDERDVSFYLNPFYRGQIFVSKEIDRYLSEVKLPVKQEYYAPCSNVRVMMRLAEAMSDAFGKSGNTEKAEALRKLIASLEV